METDHTPQVAATGPAGEDAHRAARTGEFLVVGLGASAGGIAALRRFFDHVPNNPGMAFVVIIHLSPEHESNLAQILQQHTTLPVTQVMGALAIVPNHVYVIPPAKYLAMTDNMIHLVDPNQPEGRRAPIDHFFRTLAETHGVRAAGVVLSGSGADGTIGLPRLKEMGGVTLVQDPVEAEYDEMPRSAIGTGLADFVLPVAAMPDQLIAYWTNALHITLPVEEDTAQITQATQLNEILAFLRTRTRHNFAAYKRTTVIRRIERRMQVNDQPSLPEYLALLRRHPVEIQALLRDLLISVTNFFRDREAWEALEATVLPHLFQSSEARPPIRVWIAGCATGEEAYSLAILLYEHTRKMEHPRNFQIFATDLDERAIALAREGSYPETIALDVSADRLRHFFSPEDGRYRIRKEIRDTILFAVHDVLKDPPFSRLDLVSCRNLLIYLNKDAQEQLLSLFHFALNPDAHLLLGMSESIDGIPQLYSTLDKKNHIYTRRTLPHTVVPIPSLPIPKQDPLPVPEIVPNMGERIAAVGDIHSNLLERYAPPSVVVNENYDVVHLSSRAGRYLQFVGGEPSYNLVRVIHPALRLDVRSALYLALQKGKANETRRISVQLEGHERLVRLIVHPVQEPASLRGYGLVIFDEIEANGENEHPPANGIEPMARQLEEEAQLLRDQLRTTLEQHETSVEELRASNEELQAINEELRSATEELETGKEELQAVNEELLTVNQELKDKVDEISQINSDLQNLMVSTNIGTLFLDRDLCIKRYTPQMEQLFNIIPTDLDRPLAHITHKLDYAGLVEDAQQVLQRLTPVEREIQTSNGEWYLVRLLPYRTVTDQIGGVVITFVDVTERTRAARERIALLSQLAEQRALFATVVQQMPAGLIIAEAPSGRMIYSNAEAGHLWGAPEMPLPGSIAEYSTTYKGFRADGTALRAEDWPLAQALLQGVKVVNEEISIELAEGRRVIILASAAPLRDEEGRIAAGVMTWYDISASRELEQALHAAEDHVDQRVASRTAELDQANAGLQEEILEQRMAEQAHRELLRQVVRAQEEEQRRISRELHDQLGQSLTGLKFILESLTRGVSQEHRDSLREAGTIVDDLTTRVSELSLDLRPPALDDLGLVPALLSLIARFTTQTGLRVDFQHSGLEERIDPEVETTVFRVVQEALTNVARHSGAHQARVRIISDNEVIVQIEDQGRGFDPEAVTARGTRGLLGMRERATLVGGTLVIESAPGTGTHVGAQLPKVPMIAQE